MSVKLTELVTSGGCAAKYPAARLQELLAGFVPGLPARVVSAILARADGMPLYAVETVRALVADGKLVMAELIPQAMGLFADERVSLATMKFVAGEIRNPLKFSRRPLTTVL